MAFLLPLGMPIGFAAGSEDEAGVVQVRVAGKFVTLGDELYDLWWLAHRSQFEEELLTVAEREEVPATAGSITELVQMGLLLRFDEHSSFRPIYRLQALANGLGTGQDKGDPAVFTIRNMDLSEALLVDQFTYLVWAMCDGRADLEVICTRIAGSTDFSTRYVTEHLLQAIRVLTGAFAIVLDISGSDLDQPE